jgi:hypothetical protein
VRYDLFLRANADLTPSLHWAAPIVSHEIQGRSQCCISQRAIGAHGVVVEQSTGLAKSASERVGRSTFVNRDDSRS